MALWLDDILARIEQSRPSSLHITDARRIVLETIAACGLEVAPTGEVFNPAEGAYRMSKPRPQWSAPADNSRRRFSRRR
jgi:hypothetical protein